MLRRYREPEEFEFWSPLFPYLYGKTVEELARENSRQAREARYASYTQD